MDKDIELIHEAIRDLYLIIQRLDRRNSPVHSETLMDLRKAVQSLETDEDILLAQRSAQRDV